MTDRTELRRLKGGRLGNLEFYRKTILGGSFDLSPGRFLVYLDLNKWIDLARAESRQDQGHLHWDALRTAERLVAAGLVTFPLSSAHFMEVAKIGDDSRRRNLAKLMANLSQGWFLASNRSFFLQELRTAIAGRFAKSFNMETICPLTRSLKDAFGVTGRLGAADFDDRILDSPEALEECLAKVRATGQFLEGWSVFAARSEQGRSRCRDATADMRKRRYCVLVTDYIQNDLISVLNEFGLSWEDFAALGPQGCVELLERVPTLDVEINLFVQRDEHWDRKIAPNDGIDLAFLRLAVPYCRIVITEKILDKPCSANQTRHQIWNACRP
jgi:hypothetical protein